MSTKLDGHAIDKIAQMTRSAKRIEVAPDFTVTGRYFQYDDDGLAIERIAVRPPVSSTHHTTESLVQNVRDDTPKYVTAAAYWNADGIEVKLNGTVGGSGVEVGWSHRMRFPKHPAYTAVENLTATASFTQRGLVRFLRAQLNGHVDEATIEQFRALKLTTDGATESVVAKGREAVDRRIQQQVRQAAGADIPEEIIVTIPVHDLDETRDELHEVRILVDATTGTEGGVTLELTTVLNTLRAAERLALDSLITNLKAELPGDVPVYYGEA